MYFIYFQVYIFRENLKTKDEKEKDKYRYAPLDCKLKGPHCRKFSRQRDASLHFKLYHSKYHSEVCEKCKRRFETHSELRSHQKKCDPGQFIICINFSTHWMSGPRSDRPSWPPLIGQSTAGLKSTQTCPLQISTTGRLE